MDGDARRDELLMLLQTAREPLTGTDLARRFRVSRQVVVQDIALLRAGGEKILATPQGYLLPQLLGGRRAVRTYACRHQPEEIEKELSLIIDLGGKVIDVVVEHPLYGELRGLLMLGSRSDLGRFLGNLTQTKARPLSALTEGVHLHTVEAADAAVLEKIAAALGSAGFLVQQD